MKKFKLLLSIGVLAVFFATCETTQPKIDKDYIVVIAEGQDRDDAILESKKKMLEQGKDYVKVDGESAMADGESLYKEVGEVTDGYVYDYHILKEWPNENGGLYKLKAKGKLDKGKIQNVLDERQKTMGNPRFMVIIKEDFFGEIRDPSDSLTEKQIVTQFKKFEYVDRKMLQKRLAKEGGSIIGAYDDPSEAERALKMAAELSADFLLVGKTKIVKGGEVMNSGMYSIQSTVEYKILDVSTARITAASVTRGAYPHINQEQGAQGATEKAIQASERSVIPQVLQRWSKGRIIRVIIEGMDYDTYLDKDIQAILRRIRGVNSVNARNTGDNNRIVLEVQALMDGTKLYQRMRQRKTGMGIDFTRKELSGGVVHIVVK